MLNHAISNKMNQCHHRSKQFSLHVRSKEKVEKSKVVKAIQLKFSFLKRQKKLLIIAPTGATIANISGITIHRALSI